MGISADNRLSHQTIGCDYVTMSQMTQTHFFCTKLSQLWLLGARPHTSRIGFFSWQLDHGWSISLYSKPKLGCDICRERENSTVPWLKKTNKHCSKFSVDRGSERKTCVCKVKDKKIKVEWDTAKKRSGMDKWVWRKWYVWTSVVTTR